MEKQLRTRLLLDSIKDADAGSVQYTVETTGGERIQGTIEETFFNDFKIRGQKMTTERKQRIARDNADYIEEIARRQIRVGSAQVIIK